jgi:hypothetical protein
VGAGLALLHLLTAGRYGMFRDEYYYLACAQRLAWGYVDHPPLSIALLRAAVAVLGDSVLAVRVVPALAGAALVVLTGAAARAMNGGACAQRLAGVAIAIAPLLLAMTGFHSMNALDLVIWTALFVVVLTIARGGGARGWLAVGLLAGLGLMNKLSVLVWGASLVAGLALTRHRRHFLAPELWLGGALALIVFAPHALWQAAHGWPTAEFLSAASSIKNVDHSLPAYFLGFLVEIHPVNFPIWSAGLVYLLAAPAARDFRIVGIMAVLTFAVFFMQSGKVYYLAPLAPVLLAAGGVIVGRGLERMRRPAPFAAAIVGLLLVAGAATAPLAVPLLSPSNLVAYQTRLGLRAAVEEFNEVAELDQHFADRFGWREMAESVASIARALPEPERRAALILARNYGEAAALEYHGGTLDLPPVASGHNNYALWGYAEPPDVVVAIGFQRDAIERHFEEVTLAGHHDAEWAMPYERRLPIFVARSPRRPFSEIWPELRRFI